jgi:hypothetical protein
MKVNVIGTGDTTHLPESRCTRCRHKLSAVTGVAHNDLPRPGDLTICFHCGHAMFLTDDFTVRDPSPDELRQLRADPDIQRLQAGLRNVDQKFIVDVSQKGRRTQ